MDFFTWLFNHLNLTRALKKLEKTKVGSKAANFIYKLGLTAGSAASGVNKKTLEKVVGEDATEAKKRSIKTLKTLIKVNHGAFALTIVLVITILVPIIMGIMSLVQTLNIVSSLTAMGVYDPPVYDEEGNLIEEGGWFWEIPDSEDGYGDGEDPWGYEEEHGVGDSGGNSGGAYPKDPQLKLIAQLMEIYTKSAAAASTPNFKIEPAWLLGVAIRESGHMDLNVGAGNDLFTSLVMIGNECGQGGGCRYPSHFVNGSSAHTSAFNTSQSTYDQYKTPKLGHAYGPYQLESPYLYNSSLVYKAWDKTRLVPQGSSVVPKMDTSLNFLRPNPLYIPDSNFSMAMLHQYHYSSALSNSSVLKSAEFKALSAKNQNIIKFSMVGYMYGEGSWKSSYGDKLGQGLIKLGKTNDLDTYGTSDMTWNEKTMKYGFGSHLTSMKQWNTSSGANIDLTTHKHFPWSGFFAVQIGTLEWNKWTALIKAAEKEPGSGGSSGGGAVLPLKKTSTFTPQITSQFGYRNVASNPNHEGTDIASVNYNVLGQPIYAPFDGTVVAVHKLHAAYGNAVRIRGTGVYANTYVFLLHMSSTPYLADTKTELYVGQKITAGTQIGNVGKTGNVDGAHLHFEVWVNDKTNAVKNNNIPNTDFSGYSGGAYWSVPAFHHLYGDNYKSMIKSAGYSVASTYITVTKNDGRNTTNKWKDKPLTDYVVTIS